MDVQLKDGARRPDLRRNGAISGMLSVDSVGGGVWYHSWHGKFISMEDS